MALLAKPNLCQNGLPYSWSPRPRQSVVPGGSRHARRPARLFVDNRWLWRLAVSCATEGLWARRRLEISISHSSWSLRCFTALTTWHRGREPSQTGSKATCYYSILFSISSVRGLGGGNLQSWVLFHFYQNSTARALALGGGKRDIFRTCFNRVRARRRKCYFPSIHLCIDCFYPVFLAMLQESCCLPLVVLGQEVRHCAGPDMTQKIK